MLSSQINVQNDPPKFVLCSGVTYLAWQGAVGGAGWRGDVDRRPGLVTWATLPWRLGLQVTCYSFVSTDQYIIRNESSL